jgi:hypothetical protein
MLTGGCFCRNVRYEVSGEIIDSTICHCADCGTHLTFRHADFADEIDVSTCTLDAPERVPPRQHTWTAQKLAWVHLPDALPKYRGAYPEAD